MRLVDLAPDGWIGERRGSAAAIPAGGRVELRTAASEPDRYGRIPGDVVFKDTGRSLRDRLVGAGLAFVDPTVMSEACLTALFQREREAERAGRGLWADRTIVQDAARPLAPAMVGRYVLVAGTVRSVGETKRTIYLNFGANYRTDFTVLVRRADSEGWSDRLMALEGKRVRVRGVLEAWNGGLIRVEHPAQIERLR